MDVNDVNIHDDRQLLNPQQQQPPPEKCHGNRKDQRFRRKRRARGMKQEAIEKLLNNQKRIKQKKNRRDEYITHMINENTETTTSTSSNVPNQRNNQANQITTMINTTLYKRKRDVPLQALKTSCCTVPKSASSISIVQPLPKKMKKITQTMSIMEENKNYRRPMYLKRTPLILFQMLNKRLNYSLKKKDEQQFIYTRLNLLDQNYYLEVDLQLWQSYLEIGLEKHTWPEQLSIMANTNDFLLCQQHLVNYIEDIKNQINQYQTKLTEQSELCPITSIPFEQIDHCLKEFVVDQRKPLATRNNNQITKFTDGIMENELFEIITTSYPTIDYNELINGLFSIRQKQAEIWEEQLMLLETRVLCKFLPSNFDHLQNFIAPITYTPMFNQEKAVHLKNERYKMIQEAKRTWLHIFLSAYEIKLQQYNQQYEEILIQVESRLLNNTSTNFASVSNYINRYMIYRTNQLKQNILDKMLTFRRKLLQNRQRSLSTKNMIGVSPETYLDLNSNPLNTQEWDYLSLGPSHIRLNQSALRPRKQQEIEIKNEHKEISTKVQNNLVEHHHMIRTLPIFQEYSKQLLDYLHHSYYTPLPYKDYIQAHQQAQINASIQKKLKQHKLILRVTDKGHNFYLGLAIEFEKKVQKFFFDTNAFMQLTENPLNEILNRVIQLLKHLHSKKYILKWQYEQMMPDRTKCELAHLYFNPKTHKNGIPVRPIENTIHASTTNISKFLDKILRPIFDEKCKKTTIIDGASLIEGLLEYAEQDLLKPTTIFCTFDIRNLYTMLPQEEALNILVEFLHIHGYKKVKGIPLDTIRKLASLVLKENVFVYGKNIYRQTTGGAMGSSFTLTLANIFMWKWQKRFLDRPNMIGEFYGRYIDDVFITWNKSEKQLTELLDQANTWHPNIKLEYKIGQSLPFLDVLLTNNNGRLSNSVYHKRQAEPYVIPFVSDHPRHVFINIIQTVLTRAIRYSSTFKAFNHERQSFKLMLLYNGYPSSFIDHQFGKFFHEYLYPTSFLPYIENERQFSLMRHDIIGHPTPRQSQVAASALTADIDNDQTDEISVQLQESTKKTEIKSTNYGDRLFVHYKHEKRFQSVKRDLHKVYDNVFKNTPAMNLRLIVGNRNRRDAKNELIRKRPKSAILKCKRIKTKYEKLMGKSTLFELNI